MIFKETWQQVLNGTKTQTRRPVKPGDYCIVHNEFGEERTWYPHLYGCPKRWTIAEVRDAKGRLKWQVGKTYAVQPGRGKPAIWIPPEGVPIDDPLAEYVRKTEGVRATWGPKVKEWLRSRGYREAKIRITKIRRERLQEIIVTDIQREGISLPQVLKNSGLSLVKPGVASALMYSAFSALWNSIYRKPYPLYDDEGNIIGYLRRSWEDNPEVWVLEFEKEG